MPLTTIAQKSAGIKNSFLNCLGNNDIVFFSIGIRIRWDVECIDDLSSTPSKESIPISTLSALIISFPVKWLEMGMRWKCAEL